MKTVPGVEVERVCSSTLSRFRHWMEVSGEPHVPVALPWGRRPWSLLGTRAGLEVLENRNMEPRFFQCSSCSLATMLSYPSS